MIPVIDISPDVDSPAGAQVAAAIGRACREIGFFQVVGHGVPAAVIDSAYAAVARFLAWPTEEKARLEHPHPFRGWSSHRRVGCDTDMQRFQACAVPSAAEAAALGVEERYLDYFQLCPWPDDVAFQEAFSAHFAAVRAVGRTLMSYFAVTLGLPSDYFAPALRHDVSDMAANHYHRADPADPADPTDPTGPADPIAADAHPVEAADLDTIDIVLPEHADSGMLTLLHQRGDYDGLQVRLLDGEVLTVPVRDDALVVNVGLLMSRWTNDQFLATRHRVAVPPRPGMTRTSLTTFCYPAVDTVIEPLATCVGADGPHYGPVTPYGWEAQYLAAQAAQYAANGELTPRVPLAPRQRG
ncbi:MULTISPECIES: isopenicillin N synthase family dioxygenase [Frankia]|uniref:Oxidoreductase n=1 Tax=Frankia alni (strain DSM 45986 / CECT 9034 / ACN14a) TaxID=326424 RepID=Q0RBR1_FRAAA|nr:MULTISPECIES: 2-oxoglutarate and iron-dependent oxygenase domain-containing protein [Frankia]CAJ65123.1 putative oxidoreductase [Frankia alni ACN14a]